MEEQQINYIEKQTLPSSVGALVLGILSIVFCLCYGVIGIILGIIGLILANKAIKLYSSSPELYSDSSYKNAKSGRICAIVGLSLSCFYIIVIIIYIAFIGAAIGGKFLESLTGF